MSFEPRGKVAVLMAAMRASPEKIVWPADEVAMTMEAARGNLPAYLQAVVSRGLLHRKIDGGKSYFSLQPFPEGATARSTPGTGLEQKLIPSPIYTAAELEAKQQDTRAPKFDTGWTPPKMIATRPGAPTHRTLEEEDEKLRADKPNETQDAQLRPCPDCRDEPGCISAAACAHLAALTCKGDAAASVGGAQVDQEEVVEEVPFNAALWLDGDLDLYGLIETEDGAHRVPAAQVAKLRKLLAWMPA